MVTRTWDASDLGIFTQLSNGRINLDPYFVEGDLLLLPAADPGPIRHVETPSLPLHRSVPEYSSGPSDQAPRKAWKPFK